MLILPLSVEVNSKVDQSESVYNLFFDVAILINNTHKQPALHISENDLLASLWEVGSFDLNRQI